MLIQRLSSHCCAGRARVQPEGTRGGGESAQHERGRTQGGTQEQPQGQFWEKFRYFVSY